MTSARTPVDGEATEEPFGWVYRRSFLDHLGDLAGSTLGWIAYGAARLALFSLSDRLADQAINLRREGRGPIRAIGLKSAVSGRRAGRRGRLLVHGKMREGGRFAGLCFYSTYDVAAFNKERALKLIRRFEPHAVPESLEIEEGELDLDDDGAEGVLWIARGRTFYRENG